MKHVKGEMTMFKHKIELITTSDIVAFVNTVTGLPGSIKLMDGNGFCVNGKSLLGAMATVEWDSLYCVSEQDIYKKIEKYCVDEVSGESHE